MLGGDYADGEPRKFTRLHLLGVPGARACRADAVCGRWKYRYNQLLVPHPGDGARSAFAAVIEPYCGEPFIAAARRLPVDGDTTRADAAAVEVVTLSGRRDTCLWADDFDVPRSAGPLKAAAEFAFLSTDAQGIRQAVLVRGPSLETGEVAIRLARAEYTAAVKAVDYLARRLALDAALPAAMAGSVAELVCGRRTASATLRRVEGNTVTMKLGAAYFRSTITKVDPEQSTVTCKLEPALGALPGLTYDFVAGNDGRTKFWRADYAGRNTWTLRGPPVAQDDFAPSGALRVWEYGRGDTLRVGAWAALRRSDRGWEVSGNADCEVTLPGGAKRSVSATALAENGGRVVLTD
jgi:hypothetical protein